ncbi:MAG TPA: hypothetical protein VF469_10000, partial [Kofleriaceae bacterium]
MHPTTLGSAAGAVTPRAKRNAGAWLGIGAVIVVAGAIAVVLAMPGHHPPDRRGGSGGSGGSVEGSASTAGGLADADAGVTPPDATRVAAVPVDAAPSPDARHRRVAAIRDAAVIRQDDAVGSVPPTIDSRQLAPPTSAASPTQAEIAAKLNEEGKDLMYKDRYSEAAKKFQEAVARVPEPKYFVNLCVARLQEGKLDEALTVCHAVALNHPTADQQGRANKLIKVIEAEARKQNIELHGAP